MKRTINLTDDEKTFSRMLILDGSVTKDALYSRLYGGRSKKPQIPALYRFILRTRAKLVKHGVDIQYGGRSLWFIENDAKQTLAGLLSGQDEASAEPAASTCPVFSVDLQRYILAGPKGALVLKSRSMAVVLQRLGRGEPCSIRSLTIAGQYSSDEVLIAALGKMDTHGLKECGIRIKVRDGEARAVKL